MELFPEWRNAGCASESTAGTRIFFWVMNLLCVLVVVVGAQTYTCVRFIDLYTEKTKVRCLLTGGLPLITRPGNKLAEIPTMKSWDEKKNLKRSNLKFSSHSFRLSFKIFFSSRHLIRDMSSLFSNFFLFL